VSYPYQGATDPTAVVGRRVLAAIIDGLIVLVPAGALAANQLDLQYYEKSELPATADYCDTVSDLPGTEACAEFDDRVYFTTEQPTLFSPVALGISLLMAVVLQGLVGWTIGKLICGIRTVREDGRPPGLGRALVRWLLLIVDLFPWCLPLVGFILILTGKGHRRVGDMAAHTFVVNKAAAGQPIVVPGMTTPAAPGGYPAPAPAWGPAPQPSDTGSGEAWGAAAGGAWGRDPSSADNWAAAQGYPTSGERPPPPTAPARPAPPGAPPAGAPAPGAPWGSPATGETQAVPTTPEPGPAPASPEGAPAAGPAGPPAEHTVPFTGEPAPGAAVPADVDLDSDGDATQLHPGPTAPGAEPAAPHEPAPDTEVEAPRNPEPEAELAVPAAHPLDVTGPPSDRTTSAEGSPAPEPEPEPGAEAEAGAQAPPWDAAETAPATGPEATDAPPEPAPAEPEAEGAEGAAPAGEPAAQEPDATAIAAPPSEPDPEATIVASPPAADPEATVIAQQEPQAEADKTMVAPTPVAEQPAPATYNPQWDAARGTYIVWEPGRGKWLGWDDSAKEWRPL
jgi:hypothetical protein